MAALYVSAITHICNPSYSNTSASASASAYACAYFACACACAHAYVCSYVYVCDYSCDYLHTRIRGFVDSWIRGYEDMWICGYVCTLIYTYTRIHCICVLVYAWKQVSMCVYACMCVCVYAHVLECAALMNRRTVALSPCRMVTFTSWNSRIVALPHRRMVARACICRCMYADMHA
jgi:hypothetical protein